MRIAVTGATGFIGARLLGQLTEAGHTVVAVVRSPHKAHRISRLGIEVAAGDVTSRSSLLSAFQGADQVYHLASWNKPGTDPEQAWAVNVQGTRNVLDAARSAAVPRLVYTSTLAVNSDTAGEIRDESYRFEGRHLTLYERTKAQAHQIAEQFASELEVVIAMPGPTYGPGDPSQLGELIRQVIRGRRVKVPAKLEMSLAYVDDVAYGLTLAIEKGAAGETYILAGPRTRASEVVRTAVQLVGGQPPVIVGDRLVGATQAVVRRVDSRLTVPGGRRVDRLRASRASYLGSAEKAARELGWVPRDLFVGLAETVESEIR